MKISDIQAKILLETGIKTSVAKITNGSMKGYVRIRPKIKNGEYPNFDFQFIQNLKKELNLFDYQNKPLFCTISEIHVFGII